MGESDCTMTENEEEQPLKKETNKVSKREREREEEVKYSFCSKRRSLRGMIYSRIVHLLLKKAIERKSIRHCK